MGYRNINKNSLGHYYHSFRLRTRKLSQPENTAIMLSCWCGEVVEEVK